MDGSQKELSEAVQSELASLASPSTSSATDLSASDSGVTVLRPASAKSPVWDYFLLTEDAH